MATLQTSITINRPIEEVFAFVTDVDNAAKWQSGIIEAKATSSGPTGVGTTYCYVVQVMGRKLETGGEITVYQPLARYGWKSTSGPFPMSGSTTFESVPGGTLVTDTVEATPGGFFKLAEPLLMKQQQSQMAKDMKRLKELLEA